MNESHCTFFYPENLSMAVGYVGWGNGTGGNPGSYENGLRHLASHGIVVAAANTGNPASGEEMQYCVDDAVTKWGSSIASTKVMYSGHSQGAAGALTACANDPGCDGTVLMNVAIFQILYSYDSANTRRQRGEMLILHSRFDPFANMPLNSDKIFYNTNVPVQYMVVNTPIRYAQLNTHHLEPLDDFNSFRSSATAFMLSVMGDRSDGKQFLNTLGHLRGYSLKKRN